MQNHIQSPLPACPDDPHDVVTACCLVLRPLPMSLGSMSCRSPDVVTDPNSVTPCSVLQEFTRLSTADTQGQHGSAELSWWCCSKTHNGRQHKRRRALVGVLERLIQTIHSKTQVTQVDSLARPRAEKLTTTCTPTHPA
jgi:hypothetical protein